MKKIQNDVFIITSIYYIEEGRSTTTSIMLKNEDPQ